MATFTLKNTLSATEPIPTSLDGRDASNEPYSAAGAMNPGSQTGPMASNYKFNTISVPVPRSNLQIKIPADPTKTVTITTTDLVETVFYENLTGKIPGLEVTKSAD